MPPTTEHRFNDKAYSNLLIGISASALAMILIPGGILAFLSSWATGKYVYLTLLDAEANREVVKVTAVSGDTLTIERGQGGTIARAWPKGTLVTNRVTATSLTEFAQKGVHRTVTYNPNGILTASYPGEKVCQYSAVTACQRRWWKNTEGTKWRLIAGDLCSDDYYEDGYVLSPLIIYSGANDGVVSYSNADWTTCVGASSGDAVDSTTDMVASAIHVTDAPTYQVSRAFFEFDLSEFAGLWITDATLSIYANDLQVIDHTHSFSIQQGTQADPLTMGDYDSFAAFPGTAMYGEVGVSDGEQRIDIPLTADGILYINTILLTGGTALLCVRDVYETTIIPPVLMEDYADIYFSETADTTKKPYLKLTI